MVVVQEQEAVDAISPTQKELVRSQMERLLRSPHFRNSKRYPTLLRHIVEETLGGHSTLLKERILGIEVFGRAPDYDTAADPIVRVTVAEIRKRIAQYYHEEAHHFELRIELTPGSYIPVFALGRNDEESFNVKRLTAFEATTEVQSPAVPAFPTNLVAASVPADQSILSRRITALQWYGIAAVLLMIVGAAIAGVWRSLRPSPLDQLWGPLFSSRGPVTFCLPISIRRVKPGEAGTLDQAIASVMDLSGAQIAASSTVPGHGGATTFLDHELLGENVVYSDVQAMIKLESVVEQQHRPVRVRLNMGTNLNELREGPTVFIGGLDNQWTLKLLEPLRYRFAGREADVYYIQDAKQPENKQWSVRIYDKYVAVDHDYAIVARVHSEELGEPVLLVAGIGMTGTAAAGEFLSSPAQVADLARKLGGSAALHDHDFEAVLKTDVVNGIAGPAQIVAVDVR